MAQARPPCAEHPLHLVGQQQQGRDRRGVVGLLLGRVVDGEWAGRGSRGCTGRWPRSAATRVQRRGGEQRDPQPAVGAEALLRREVVDVGLGRRRPAARRRPLVASTSTSAPGSAPGTRRMGMATPVEVSLCGQRVGVHARPPPAAAGWLPGVELDHAPGRPATARAAVTLANFAENSPNDKVLRPLADQRRTPRCPRTPWRRRCRARPRSRRAGRTARPGPPGPAGPGRGPAPGGARCPGPRRPAAASAASCLGAHLGRPAAEPAVARA